MLLVAQGEVRGGEACRLAYALRRWQGVGALVRYWWWHCYGLGASALVPEREIPNNQHEVEGGRGDTIMSWGWGGDVIFIHLN
jgi:hypothetical protein